MIYGVDVASWQGHPDWPQLRAEGHEFMISKVTGEGSYFNPYAAVNIQRARAAGMIVGGYDWVEPQRADEMEGDEAALDYLRTLDIVAPRQAGDLLCVDFETPEWANGVLGRNIEGWMQRYLYTLKDVGGQEVIVYTAPYFLAETGAGKWPWLGADFHYWIAAPGPLAQLPDDAPWPSGNLVKPWPVAIMHQHQWHATSPAVAGEFDRNRFEGTRAELLAYGKHGPGGDEMDRFQPETVTMTTNSRGEAIVVINYGGEVKVGEGVNLVDAGSSWRNAQGRVYDRSVRANQFEPWHLRPAVDSGA